MLFFVQDNQTSTTNNLPGIDALDALLDGNNNFLFYCLFSRDISILVEGLRGGNSSLLAVYIGGEGRSISTGFEVFFLGRWFYVIR